MKKIILEKKPSFDITVVSNYFIDEYMPKANGEYVKMYLYLLKCNGTSSDVTVNSLADVFDYTEKDVMRALTYWEQIGLLALDYDANNNLNKITINELRPDTPVTFKYVPDQTAKPAKNGLVHDSDTAISVTDVTESHMIAEAESYTTNDIPQKRDFTNQELLKLTSNSDIKELLYICQAYLGKTLSASDTNTILYFYDGLHFSVELIEYLIEYCASIKHTSLRYIEKVALDWAQDNVCSVNEAKERTMLFSNSYYPIMKAFGISGRNPAAIERAIIDKWIKEYAFSMDIIVEACNRTISATSKPSFPYADSILQRWHEKGVSALSDLKALDAKHNQLVHAAKEREAQPKQTTKFNSFPQRSYDYGELERQLLGKK